MVVTNSNISHNTDNMISAIWEKPQEMDKSNCAKRGKLDECITLFKPQTWAEVLKVTVKAEEQSAQSVSTTDKKERDEDATWVSTNEDATWVGKGKANNKNGKNQDYKGKDTKHYSKNKGKDANKSKCNWNCNGKSNWHGNGKNNWDSYHSNVWAGTDKGQNGYQHANYKNGNDGAPNISNNDSAQNHLAKHLTNPQQQQPDNQQAQVCNQDEEQAEDFEICLVNYINNNNKNTCVGNGNFSNNIDKSHIVFQIDSACSKHLCHNIEAIKLA